MLPRKHSRKTENKYALFRTIISTYLHISLFLLFSLDFLPANT